jgi:hypothetical protein
MKINRAYFKKAGFITFGPLHIFDSDIYLFNFLFFWLSKF